MRQILVRKVVLALEQVHAFNIIFLYRFSLLVYPPITLYIYTGYFGEYIGNASIFLVGKLTYYIINVVSSFGHRRRLYQYIRQFGWFGG
jgi:hypothetical protein